MAAGFPKDVAHPTARLMRPDLLQASHDLQRTMANKPLRESMANVGGPREIIHHLSLDSDVAMLYDYMTDLRSDLASHYTALDQFRQALNPRGDADIRRDIDEAQAALHAADNTAGAMLASVRVVHLVGNRERWDRFFDGAWDLLLSYRSMDVESWGLEKRWNIPDTEAGLLHLKVDEFANAVSQFVDMATSPRGDFTFKPFCSKSPLPMNGEHSDAAQLRWVAEDARALYRGMMAMIPSVPDPDRAVEPGRMTLTYGHLVRLAALLGPLADIGDLFAFRTVQGEWPADEQPVMSYLGAASVNFALLAQNVNIALGIEEGGRPTSAGLTVRVASGATTFTPELDSVFAALNRAGV